MLLLLTTLAALLCVILSSQDDICTAHGNNECVDTVDLDIDEWFRSFNSHFKHDQIDILPIDKSVIDPNLNHIPKTVSNAIFSILNPQPISNPKLISISQKAFNQTLNLNFPSNIKDKLYSILTSIISGNISMMNEYIPNMVPYAHCYCGHQFGYFSGQLGDGRALALGEYHLNDNNHTIYELQLKGSGKTPFSRKGDGRAVLRSSIREYLMSEYMANVNIPTSRAFMLITSTSDTVRRDVFYNGNVKPEPVAIVLRGAPNWIRFGSFELHIASNGRFGPMRHESRENQRNLIKSLLDYVIEHHYVDIWQKHKDELTDSNMYKEWFIKVVNKSVKLVAKWQCIGFVHGVLNTDNLHILGIGIDYGPYGMMEYYQEDYVPNYSDDTGRYAYNKQVEIFKWNLAILAQSLHKVDLLSIRISKDYLDEYFDELYAEYYVKEMKQKFGLIYEMDKDKLGLLIHVFFNALKVSVCDMTNSFRALNMISINGINQCYENGNGDCDKYEDEIIMAQNRKIEDDVLIEYLVNQCVTPSHYKSLQKRKHMIRAHNNQFKLEDNDMVNNIANMDEMEKKKYDKQVLTQFVTLYRGYVDSEWNHYRKIIQKNNDDIESSSIGKRMKKLNDERVKLMNNINPKYILRNHLLQKAIEMAEKEDYSEIEKIKSMIMSPFVDNEIYNDLYDKPVAEQLCDTFGNCDLLSCSS